MAVVGLSVCSCSHTFKTLPYLHDETKKRLEEPTFIDGPKGLL